MAQYVCKVLDRDARLLRLVPFTADCDRNAIDQAILLQLVTSLAAGFQVWDGVRLVLAFQNHRPAWRSEPQAVETPAVKSGRRTAQTASDSPTPEKATPKPPAH